MELSLVMLTIIVAQQIFYMRQIQKLVDKTMSRSYTEYRKADEKNQVKIKLPNDPPEDLRILQGFSL